jgi:hypothetical protein
MRRRGWARAAVLGCGLLGVGVSPATAQRRVEITPFVAGYVPTTGLGRMRVGHVLSQPVQVTAEMQTTGAFGGKLDVWTGSRWGIEGLYFYAPSSLRIATGPVGGTVKANVQGGLLKAFFRATNENSGTDLFVSAGGTAIQHAGQAFDLAANQLDFGGTVGGGLHVIMSSQVTFRIDADLMVYPWSFGVVGLNDTKTQTDLLVSVGLALKLAR